MGPRSVALGDLDGDGRLDAAVANGASNDISLLYQTAPGTFVEQRKPANTPSAVAIGDLNNDGRSDLAVANSASDDVAVYLQDALGSLVQPAASPYAAATNTIALVVGDVNSDGRADFIAVNSSTPGGSLTVYLQDQHGALAQMPGSPMTMGSGSSLAVGDFTADGRLDVAVAYVGGYVALFVQNTRSQLVPAAAAWPVGTDPQGIAAGDLNGDGRLDLATANAGSNDVTIYVQNAGGGLTPSLMSPLPVGTTPTGLAIGDLDGDGREDVVIANRGSNNVSVYLQDAQGNLSESTTSPVSVGIGPMDVAIGDIDGDGRTDLGVANSGSGDVTICTPQ
ncbi:FG-GAP repeat domain-containing protein [Planctomycetota bacterium]